MKDGEKEGIDFLDERENENWKYGEVRGKEWGFFRRWKYGMKGVD